MLLVNLLSDFTKKITKKSDPLFLIIYILFNYIEVYLITFTKPDCLINYNFLKFLFKLI